MRLRILDINTPYVWLTVFFQRSYGKPWLEISFWQPNTWKNWWVHVWMWEQLPSEQGSYAVEPLAAQGEQHDH